jgi:hypothetical protein
MQDHRDRLKKNKKGVMGLPIKLMVTMTIIAISLPALTGIMDDSERGMADAEMGQEAERFMNAAVLAHRSGDGSSRTVSISLPAGCELCVGGEGSDAFCVRSMYNGEIVSKNYFEMPVLKISEQMTFSGKVTLKLTSVDCGNIPEIEVTVL